jgi:hypothetical protein
LTGAQRLLLLGAVAGCWPLTVIIRVPRFPDARASALGILLRSATPKQISLEGYRGQSDLRAQDLGRQPDMTRLYVRSGPSTSGRKRRNVRVGIHYLVIRSENPKCRPGHRGAFHPGRHTAGAATKPQFRLITQVAEIVHVSCHLGKNNVQHGGALRRCLLESDFRVVIRRLRAEDIDWVFKDWRDGVWRSPFQRGDGPGGLIPEACPKVFQPRRGFRVVPEAHWCNRLRGETWRIGRHGALAAREKERSDINGGRIAGQG